MPRRAANGQWPANCTWLSVVLPLPENPVSLLLVSAQPSDHHSLARILARSHWKLKVRTTCAEGLALLRDSCLPVVICDDESTGGHWQSLLADLADLPAPPALIVSSRLADERLWGKVLNLGGYDLLPTPFVAAEVLQVCFQAWKFRERESARTRVSGAG